MTISILGPGWLIAMAVVPAVFWVLPTRARDAFLAISTIAFLVVLDPESLCVLALFAVITFQLTTGNAPPGWRFLIAGTLIAIVLLGYKYRAAAGSSGTSVQLVPLGLSFYAVRCLHYIVERYKGVYRPHDFRAFAYYLFFLPTLLAGPIHRFGTFERDRRRRRWDPGMFSTGLERILYGYAKVTVLGNMLVSGVLATYIEGIGPQNSALFEYLDILRHGLNLYFQFSGYSDIAIGFAMLLGYRVMENFNWPFLKKNISEFWRAWHISLTSWVREHVYLLGISATRSPLLSVILAMMVLGIWHELSFRYVAWGAYHGLGIAAWQVFQRLKPGLAGFDGKGARAIAHALSVFVTFHFVMFGFAIVKEPDLRSALDSLSTVLLFWN